MPSEPSYAYARSPNVKHRGPMVPNSDEKVKLNESHAYTEVMNQYQPSS